MAKVSPLLDLLPSEWTVTAVLKVLGLIIGTTSVLWALMQKTTYEDEEGRKHLTWAGRVAVALAVGSFLVAGISSGFDAVLAAAKDQRNREQAAEGRLKAIQELNERRLLAAEVRAGQAHILAAQASHQSALAQQQIILLQESAAARRRDVRLSQDLNASSRRNLRSAQDILRNVQRAANPLGNIHVELDLILPIANASDALLSELRTVYQNCVGCSGFQRTVIRTADIRAEGQPSLRGLAKGLLARIALLNAAVRREDPRDVDFAGEVPGDLYIAMGDPESLFVVFDPDGNPLSITLQYRFDSSTANPTFWSRTDQMASTNDLVGARAAVQMEDFFPHPESRWLRGQTPECYLSIESANRRFEGSSSGPLIGSGRERRCTLTVNEAEVSPRYRPRSPTP